MAISINDFVNVTLQTPGTQLGAFNQNILTLLTKDVPIQNYGAGALATATVTSLAVSSIAVSNGGTGYLTPRQYS